MGGPQHKGALHRQRNLSRAQSELQPEHPAKPPPSSRAIIPEICAFCSKGALGSMHVPRSRLKCRRCHVTQGGLAATVCFSETAHGTAGPNCSAPLVDADEGDKCLLPGKALPDASTDAVPKRHPCLNLAHKALYHLWYEKRKSMRARASLWKWRFMPAKRQTRCVSRQQYEALRRIF